MYELNKFNLHISLITKISNPQKMPWRKWKGKWRPRRRDLQNIYLTEDSYEFLRKHLNQL